MHRITKFNLREQYNEYVDPRVIEIMKEKVDNMICPKCGSNHVNVQMVSESQLKTKHRSVLWWLFIGWWWLPFKWIFLTIPALIVKILVPKRQKIVNKYYSMCVCQSCGYSWRA